MKKTAICGVWHVHAGGYTNEAKKLTEVLGVWDADEQRKLEFCKEFDLPAFDTLDDLIASEAEAVIVCTATDIHPEVMIKLANAKKDIFTEKVLALTNEDAQAIAKAVEENGVKFAISLVHRYASGPRTVKQVVDSGELGKINYIRVRNAHSGSVDGWLPKHFYSAKECGGGAMIDLGAHGMYLTDWIHGRPDTYKSVFTNSCTNEATNAKNEDGVEDNAITLMGYKDGCIALNETGFVSSCYPLTVEVGGELGFVRSSDGEVIKATKATGGEIVAVEALEAQPEPLEQFLTDNVLEGCGMAEALTLTYMMVEAYRP